MVFHEENFPFVDVFKRYIPQAETPLLQAWCKRSAEQEDLRISSEKKAKEEEEIPTKHIAKSDVSTIPMPASPTQQVSGDTNMQHEEDHSDSTSEEDMTVMPTSSQLEKITETTHPMIRRRKEGISKPNPRYVMVTVKGTLTEPRTVAEALAHEGWHAAMGEEIGTCEET